MSPTASTSPLTDPFFQKSAERWNRCAELPETSLLRLAVLRDIIHYLHAEGSRCLAQSGRSKAKGLSLIRPKVDALRYVDLTSGSLLDVLSRTHHRKSVHRALPEEIVSLIGREKLQRYDRKWEAEMIAEAASCGWELWHLTASVRIESAEPFHRELCEALWPQAIVLFVEPADDSPISAGPAANAGWRGRWLITFKPGSDPAGQSLPSRGISTDPAIWTRLFPTGAPK